MVVSKLAPSDRTREPRVSDPKTLRVADSISELIGGTPLLRLRWDDADGAPEVYAKLESMNPGGSVKDRTARALIEFGEREGLLKPGGTIVEPTSGNTGVGLAMIAAERGYRCIFSILDKSSPERIALLRAYGAEVVECPTCVPPDDPSSYYSVAERIAEEADAFQPRQYDNLANQLVHYETTGPEIWEQSEERVTHFVAGAGTGGTISGAGRYLKERNQDLSVVCADPIGSIYSDPRIHSYLIEGVGEDLIPGNFDRDVVDRFERVSDAEAFATCREVVADFGLLTGGSGGMVIAAAKRVAQQAPVGGVVVALVPDSGRGYLSRLYSDSWLLQQGFVPAEAAPSVGHLPQLAEERREFRVVPAEATVAEALELLLTWNARSLPVSAAPAPEVAGEISGSVSVAGCLAAMQDEQASARDLSLSAALEECLPLVGIGQDLEMAIEVGSGRESVVVLEEGRPVADIAVDEMQQAMILHKAALQLNG